MFPQEYQDRISEIREEAIALRAYINKKMDELAIAFREFEEDVCNAGKAQTFTDWKKDLYKDDPAFYVELEGIIAFDEKSWKIAEKLGQTVKDEAIESPDESEKTSVVLAARQLASAAFNGAKKALSKVNQRSKRAAKKYKPGAVVGFVEEFKLDGENLLGKQAIVDEDLGEEVSLRFGDELINNVPKTAIKALTKKQLAQQTEVNVVTGEIPANALVEEIDRLKTELQTKDWEIQKLSEEATHLHENSSTDNDLAAIIVEELNAFDNNIASITDTSRVRKLIRSVIQQLLQSSQLLTV